MNTGYDRTLELAQRFGVAGKEITGAIIVAKDSRDITNADLINLVHTIKTVPNKEIMVTCGTYMLPIIGQVLDMHFGNGKSYKIIGIAGGWLPPSQEAQDVDFNIGGTIAAIKAFKSADQRGIVFVQFHGEIIRDQNLAEQNLHPSGINPRFARPLISTL